MVDSKQWFFKRNGKVFGPYSRTRMQRFIENGTVFDTDLIRSEHSSWLSLENSDELIANDKTVLPPVTIPVRKIYKLNSARAPVTTRIEFRQVGIYAALVLAACILLALLFSLDHSSKNGKQSISRIHQPASTQNGNINTGANAEAENVTSSNSSDSISRPSSATTADIPLSYVELNKKVKPSLVTIYSKVGDKTATGSGFIVDQQHIATNLHVVEDADNVLVKFQFNDEIIKADGLASHSRERDVAILRIPINPTTVQPMGIATSIPSVGESVAAFGNPDGLEYSMYKGIVSAVRPGSQIFNNQSNARWLQLDIRMGPGMSGGPLVNLSGQVVGMNTRGQQDSGRGDWIHFAISNQDIFSQIEQAQNTDRINTSFHAP